MTELLANGGLFAGIFLLLVFPALLRRSSRGWVLLAILLVVADFFATAAGADWQKFIPLFSGCGWNWFGKILSIAVMLTAATILAATEKYKLREFGLSFLQAPGTWRALLFVALPVCVIQLILTLTLFGPSSLPARETVLFQATMPGLSEELAFRGVLLALLNRAFTARFNLGGASIGYGAIAITAFFGIGHGVIFGDDLQLHTSVLSGALVTVVGCILIWLRLRTNSLVVPVVVHNAINVISFVVPRVL